MSISVDSLGNTTFGGTVAGPNLLATKAAVPISGIVDLATLPAAAPGAFFSISGTTDTTITLPTAAIGSGVIYGFNVATTASKRIIVQPTGAQTIDGATKLYLTATNSLVIVSTGSALVSLAKDVPVVASGSRPTGQSIPNATWTVVDFNVIDVDTAAAVTVGAGWSYKCPAPGFYNIKFHVISRANASRTYGQLRVNTVPIRTSHNDSLSGTGTGPPLAVDAVVQLNLSCSVTPP